jgi:hypothetical protein
MQDDELRDRIGTARARSLVWLDAMQAADAPAGVSRISAAHDALIWPGVLLPGTYNAVLCRDLLGALPADRAALANWLLGFRRPDGIFRVTGMRDANVYKKPDRDETWRYIDWHVTNYSLGAMQALAPGRQPVLDFARPYLDPMVLKAWLADRDLRDPWQEGNNIVNLASFLLGLRHEEPQAVERALAILFDWHDYHREPATGFLGVGQLSDATCLLHAFAGSMHNFHLWYATGRPLPGQDRAVDYALSRATAIDSACIDVDLVDLLAHAYDRLEYRRDDTRAWLRGKLAALLNFQSDDGGFADERTGIRRQDGWIRGYGEPQGISNTFSTWFRWIAIAMSADILWPGHWDWRFRRMLGVGYRGRPA